MGNYRIAAVVALCGVSALTLGGGTSAVAVDPGQWVLIDEIEAHDSASVAVDPVTGTAHYETFNPAHPPAQLYTVSSATLDQVAVVPGGLAAGFANDSVDESTGRTYMVMFGSSEVLAVDNRTGQIEHTFTNTQWTPYASVVDDARNLIYVVDGNDHNWHPSGSVTVLDGATDTQVTQVFDGNSLAFPAISSKHQKLYVPIEAGGGGVLVFDTATNQEVGHISGSGELTLLHPLMAIADDDLDLVFLLQDDPLGDQVGSIAIIDSSTDEVAGPAYEFGRYLTADSAMTYDPVRKQLIVGGTNADTHAKAIITIDAITGRVISTTEVIDAFAAFSITGLAVDPVAHRLVVGALNRVLLFQWQVPALPVTGPTSALAVIVGLASAGAIIAGILATRRGRPGSTEGSEGR